MHRSFPEPRSVELRPLADQEVQAFDWDALDDAQVEAGADALTEATCEHVSSEGGHAENACEHVPGDDGTSDSPPAGELEDWVVVHTYVVRRREASTSAPGCGSELLGTLLRGTCVVDTEGHPWLRVEDSRRGVFFLLVDGSHLGIGVLLERSGYCVREVVGRGRSIFATRAFEAGETVFTDVPYFTRPPPKDFAARQWTPEWVRDFGRVSEPLIYPGESAEQQARASGGEVKIRASAAMVRSAIGYATASPGHKKKILAMWHPDTDYCHPLVKISAHLARLCIKHLPECRGFEVLELQKAIMAIEMNIFAGGRVFENLRLVNHSCCPNVVYVGMTGEWRFKSLRRIEAGEELFHSYLGEELLLPTQLRRRHLWRSKCFVCSCDRCSPRVLKPAVETESVAVAVESISFALSAQDPTRDIPCRRCFEVLDAEQRSFHGEDSGVGESWAGNGGLAGILLAHTDPVYSKTSNDIADSRWLPNRCWNDPQGRGPYMKYDDGTWICQTCGQAPEEPLEESLLEFELNLGRHAEKTFLTPVTTPAVTTFRNMKDIGDLEMVKAEFVAFAVDLAITVWGTLGLRHWASQWARLLCVDMLIARLQLCTPTADWKSLMAYLLVPLPQLLPAPPLRGRPQTHGLQVHHVRCRREGSLRPFEVVVGALTEASRASQVASFARGGERGFLIA